MSNVQSRISNRDFDIALASLLAIPPMAVQSASSVYLVNPGSEKSHITLIDVLSLGIR